MYCTPVRHSRARGLGATAASPRGRTSACESHPRGTRVSRRITARRSGAAFPNGRYSGAGFLLVRPTRAPSTRLTNRLGGRQRDRRSFSLHAHPSVSFFHRTAHSTSSAHNKCTLQPSSDGSRSSSSAQSRRRCVSMVPRVRPLSLTRLVIQPPPPTEAAITLPALLPRSTSSPEPSATTSRPRSAPTPRAAPPSAGMMSMMEEGVWLPFGRPLRQRADAFRNAAFSDDSNTVALAGPRHKGEVILPCTIM